jgi:hypothetical protein
VAHGGWMPPARKIIVFTEQSRFNSFLLWEELLMKKNTWAKGENGYMDKSIEDQIGEELLVNR